MDIRKEVKPSSVIEDDPSYEKYRPCASPMHPPPNMIVIPQGKRLRHVCPDCGKETILYPSRVTL